MALDLKDTANLFVNSIGTAVKNVTGQDAPAIEGFAQNQLQSLAHQSALITGMIEANQFTDDELKFYLIGLKQMAMGFAQTLIGMIVVEVQRLFNAIVTAIYTSINTLAKVALPLPV
ncbi:hypothetical protein [Paraburkholderia rhizosphaerae]|uniref:Uncharacterized protein n=1 Tax=Paraburkholderia rhizosphaerae TaxID=480658 RepID=A0A4R8LLD6_9BURK|nr:hypothetical protein [Paraburkholderia rhizosphaerae]TDY45407.1 hypothetical protein BX592_11474 [Paraburkholderia rhizosphaerae]